MVMQEIKMQNFGANNPYLSNYRTPLKANNPNDKEIFLEIGHHFGANKIYLEICISHRYKATTGKTLLFDTVEQAKAFAEKAFNGKILEVA
jgi:hypothetical protein